MCVTCLTGFALSSGETFQPPLRVYDNFVDRATYETKPQMIDCAQADLANCTVVNTTVVMVVNATTDWPDEAVEVIQDSGPRS